MKTILCLTDTSPVPLPDGGTMDFFTASDVVHYIRENRDLIIKMLADPSLLAHIEKDVNRESRCTEEPCDENGLLLPPPEQTLAVFSGSKKALEALKEIMNPPKT